MRRVTIKYSADLENVPNIAMGLFDEAVESLAEAFEIAKEGPIYCENNTRTPAILDLIDSARTCMIKADQSLQDAAELLTGYESAMRSVEEAPPEEAPAPPSQKSPPKETQGK